MPGDRGKERACLPALNPAHRAGKKEAKINPPSHTDFQSAQQGDSSAIEWLLTCPEPGVRLQVLSDLLDLPQEDPRLRQEQAEIQQGPWVQALLAGQKADGSFGVHPYHKWTGAHWRLVSLVELGLPDGGVGSMLPHWLPRKPFWNG